MKKSRHDYKEQIIDMYINKTISIDNIGKELGLNRETVTIVLKENNISIRQKQGRYSNFYSFNSKFFEIIDTEEKAYWLGFIYADGYITKKNTMGISLSDIDLSHLEKFKSSLNSTHPINIYKNNSGYNTKNKYCNLQIANTENYSNLVRCGVIPRKTKILTFPNESILPFNLVHHFIRGYFDGDGSVSITKNSYIRKDGSSQKKISCSILGTELFLLTLVNYLPFKQKIYKYKNKDIYFINFAGTKAKQFYEYLYKDVNIYLERKKEKFDKYFLGGK